MSSSDRHRPPSAVEGSVCGRTLVGHNSRRWGVSRIAIVARVRVKEGRADEYLSALAPLLEQVEKEPETLLYLVQRSTEDPHLFWTSELYADEEAFELHGSSEAHAAATPAFTDVIGDADVIVGEAVMGKGLSGGRPRPRRTRRRP